MQWGNQDASIRTHWQWRIFSKQQSGCINLNSRGSHTGAAQYVLAKYYYFTEAVVRQLCRNILLKAVMGLLFPAVECSVWISCTTSHWWCDAHLLRFGHCSLHNQVYMHHAQEYIRGSNSFPVFSVYFWPLYNACSHYLLHSHEDTDTAEATIELTDSLVIGAQVEVVSENIVIDPKQAGTTGKKGEAFMLYAVALQCHCTACILSDVHGFNQWWSSAP